MSEIVEHLPLREVVAERIRQLILQGDLLPGSRLVEEQIAERLGVSRNPIREAIRSLEHTGLIEVVPRKGAYVSAIDDEELRQIQEVRVVIEGFAAEMAAMRRTDDDIDRLDHSIEEGTKATATGDRVTALLHHRAFHIAVEEAAHNPQLERVVAPLRQRSELMFAVVQEMRTDITWAEHGLIRDAIAGQDPARARELMQAHIVGAVETFTTRGT